MMQQTRGACSIWGTLESSDRVLSPEALSFVAELHQQFNAARLDLIKDRAVRQTELDAGSTPRFLSDHPSRSDSSWTVAPAPSDLDDRRVEITGPVERKMMINALNSGAHVFMADFEDSLCPTWENVVHGQLNLMDAVRREIGFCNAAGKHYRLNEQTATLVVRPRGWHLVEKHVLVDDQPISASLFDFGLYFFHNAQTLLDQGSGPYFYLPKLESHREARLWNEVFTVAQKILDVPYGSIRATVLIETILAAFEMEEILYELRHHAVGLNAGRWDYIFSVIKKFNRHPDFVLPDRDEVTMAVPFMRAYAELLVKTCHRHGAHAIGGMAAFIPNRRDPQVTEMALTKVRKDKEREANDGFDGTWVAHPDLVPVAKDVFNGVLRDRPHQKDQLRQDVAVDAETLLDVKVSRGKITEAGFRNNINVALQYLNAWLQGNGAAAIHNLMEDAATAEIARAQVWQWIRHGKRLDDGRPISTELYEQIRSHELEKLEITEGRYHEAAKILDQLVLAEPFTEFLTPLAYQNI